MKKVSGSGDESMALKAHKYAKAGTYKFSFRVTYCTPSGPVAIVRSTNFTVKSVPAVGDPLRRGPTCPWLPCLRP